MDDLRHPSWLNINGIINRVTAAHTLSCRPSAGLSIYPQLLGNELDESRISRMISTIDATNGFRSELMPMALASSSSASLALRNAIMAVSAFHRYGATAALQFKAKAVFDETEENWYFHLDGAKAMLYHLWNVSGGNLRYQFLYTWLVYHEVLGAASQPLQLIQKGTPSIDLLADDSFDETVVIGSLGCSLEVLKAIHGLNQIRCKIMSGPPDITEALILEGRLTSLTQNVSPVEGFESQTCTIEEHRKVIETAELYRLSALLYHQRIHADYLDRRREREAYLTQAFHIFNRLSICTSPWPLFVIACEADSDEQRLVIIRMLDHMDEARSIGNIFILREIIQSFWKQKDLAADCDARSSQPSWLNSLDSLLVDSKGAVPWFI
ncbi:fungal-specific transcription factor domain-containing protein [Penicillium angulare]|uniref:fungal-specific transcription factor domain-containing protein n=1 Tax=Penicillium angulare TaxID=116970 RepID=UPI00253FBAF4|nr:fungal-specific transcription factor domain-containing protein [Penicillium angulare]KAJ5291995.1 fungal-specific transcription factor domain-containing protein [Penicillium angulare]